MLRRLVHLVRDCPRRGLSLVLVVLLSCPETPALALRTQAGLESEPTRTTLTTTLTGLEELSTYRRARMDEKMASWLRETNRLSQYHDRLVETGPQGPRWLVKESTVPPTGWPWPTKGDPVREYLFFRLARALGANVADVVIPSGPHRQQIGQLVGADPNTLYLVRVSFDYDLRDPEVIQKTPEEALAATLLTALLARKWDLHQANFGRVRSAAELGGLARVTMAYDHDVAFDKRIEALPVFFEAFDRNTVRWRAQLQDPRRAIDRSVWDATLARVAAFSLESFRETVRREVAAAYAGNPAEQVRRLRDVDVYMQFLARQRPQFPTDAATFFDHIVAPVQSLPPLTMETVSLFGSQTALPPRPVETVSLFGSQTALPPRPVETVSLFGSETALPARPPETENSLLRGTDYSSLTGLEEPPILATLAAQRDTIHRSLDTLRRRDDPIALMVFVDYAAWRHLADQPLQALMADHANVLMDELETLLGVSVLVSQFAGDAELAKQSTRAPEFAVLSVVPRGVRYETPYIPNADHFDPASWQVIVPTDTAITSSTLLPLILTGLLHPGQTYEPNMTDYQTTLTFEQIAARLAALDLKVSAAGLEETPEQRQQHARQALLKLKVGDYVRYWFGRPQTWIYEVTGVRGKGVAREIELTAVASSPRGGEFQANRRPQSLSGWQFVDMLSQLQSDTKRFNFAPQKISDEQELASLRAALAATVAGLEEPTLADVQNAFDDLGRVLWNRPLLAPAEIRPVCFVGSAMGAAPIRHQMLNRGRATPLTTSPTYALATAVTDAERLIAVGVPAAQIIGLAYNDPAAPASAAPDADLTLLAHNTGTQPLPPGVSWMKGRYRALGIEVTLSDFEASTAAAALRAFLRDQAPRWSLAGRPLRVIADREAALQLLRDDLIGSLEENTPSEAARRMTDTLSRAFDVAAFSLIATRGPAAGLEAPTALAPAADPLAVAAQAYFAQLVDPGSVERLQTARTAVAAAVGPSGIAPPEALARLDALWQTSRAGRSDVPGEINQPLRRVHVGVGDPSEEALLTQALAPAIAEWIWKQLTAETGQVQVRSFRIPPGRSHHEVWWHQDAQGTRWLLRSSGSPLPEDFQALTVLSETPVVLEGRQGFQLLHFAAGLEEPTLADVQQALAPLDGLQWTSGTASPQAEAIICAGDAEGAAAMVEQMLDQVSDPKPVAYAVVTDPAHAERLITAGLLQTRIRGLAYGNDQRSLTDAYHRLGVSVYASTADTAEQAVAEALATQLAPDAVVNGLRVTYVLTDRLAAQTYLQTLGGHLQFADGPAPERLAAAIPHALDVVSRYL